MRFLFRSLLLSSLIGSVQLANADSDLLMKNNCFACHGVDKRKYGPKFIEVAAKYATTNNASEMLAAKIKVGGTGVWGEDIMPPQPQVSDADALAIAIYLLTLK